MNNKEVIIAFLEGRKAHTPTREIGAYYLTYTYKGQTLKTDGNELINYDTKIAYKKDKKVYLSGKKYSPTTTKIQGMVHHLASLCGYEVVEY